jgi:hypothetical protein
MRGGWLSDITVTINGHEFNVHKDVLTKCEFFKAALNGQFAQETKFEILGASGPATFENICVILDQLYGIEIEFTRFISVIAELYSIVKYIGYDEMAAALRPILLEQICKFNFDNKCSLSMLRNMSIFTRE